MIDLNTLRIPKMAPLPCFGLERDTESTICVKCPHEADCAKYSLYDGNGTPLSRVKFDVGEPDNKKMEAKKDKYTTGEQVNVVYTRAYNRVLGGAKSRSVKDAHAVLCVQNARTANVPLDVYFECLLRAHKASRPGHPFYFTSITGKFALDSVKKFKKLILSKSGSFSVDTLAEFYGEPASNLSGAFLDCELKIAKWIIGSKLKLSGPVDLLAFYSRFELSMHPSWLVTEQFYMAHVYRPYAKSLGDNDASRALRQHRSLVLKTVKDMRLSGHRQIISAWRMRDKSAASAVKHVLAAYGYAPAHFVYKDKFVADPVKLWAALGVAIKHHKCYRYVVEKDPQCLDDLKNSRSAA